MRVSVSTLYIYSIYRKINNVIETGENMYKEFHKQLDYIISEMKKEKERNPKSFAFDDDNFKSTKDNNAFGVCRKIILNMSKVRLNKLISCRGLNGMSSFSSWKSNSFCTSGYSSSHGRSPGPYTVSRSNFNSIMDSKTIYNRKEFIRFICAVINSASSIYPKFRKQVIKKGEGLAVYSSINHSMSWKGINKDYYNLLKRTKDSRIKRYIIRNMEAKTLISFYDKEIKTGNVDFSPDINYKINERLKCYSMNDFDRFIEDGLSEDRTSVKYDWSRSSSIVKCMQYLAESWTHEERVNKFQDICDVSDNHLAYGFFQTTATRCLHALIFYIPKAKVPFILNRLNKNSALNNSLRWAIEADENKWSP